jgi:AcrR family transcriptional regulator
VTTERRQFRREGEDRRREDLVAATLSLVAEGGAEAATLRAIAARAGVTAGLIRHYFGSKEELLRAAFHDMMTRMTAESGAGLDAAPPDPVARLATFVADSLRPPVVDGRRVVLWAGFLHLVRRDKAMHDVHAMTYHAYRSRLEALIAALPRAADPARTRADAIACNAVIDGLWMEGSILPETFAPGEIVTIGLTSCGAILGADLLSALPPPSPEVFA